MAAAVSEGVTARLEVETAEGKLGEITLHGDKLMGSSPSIQAMVDSKLGLYPDAEQAMRHLAGYNNGYLWISPMPEDDEEGSGDAENMYNGADGTPVSPIQKWNPLQPRNRHGEWVKIGDPKFDTLGFHGVAGSPEHAALFRDHARTSRQWDRTAFQSQTSALTRAADAIDAHSWAEAAEHLRTGANAFTEQQLHGGYPGTADRSRRLKRGMLAHADALDALSQRRADSGRTQELERGLEMPATPTEDVGGEHVRTDYSAEDTPHVQALRHTQQEASEGILMAAGDVQAGHWHSAADQLRELRGKLDEQIAYLDQAASERYDPAYVAQLEAATKRFHPDQPRDEHGRWVHGGAGLLERFDHITADEARGNSRPVSEDEFNRIAGQGRDRLAQMRDNSAPIDGLDRNWTDAKKSAWAEVQKPWGGATIDAHTGQPLASDADKYALSVKPEGVYSVTIPEHSNEAEFSRAMDAAKDQFRPILENQQHYLGVFHDDDLNRIDIDPVVVVDSVGEVEAIGAFTHAIGGAYHFKSGDGFWPPHVGDTATKADRSVHWKGPGQWRSYAEAVQRGEPAELPGDDTARMVMPTADQIAFIDDALARVEKRKGGRGGNAQTLRDYWSGHGHPGPSHGAERDAIRWGTPGDFMRCVAQVTEHAKMSPEHAKGYCNLRHKDALGYYPATHARMERGKTATPDIFKVGPKGYIHGWIYVGNKSDPYDEVGSAVNHPTLGQGRITGVTYTSGGSHAVNVRFGGGEEHAFEFKAPPSRRRYMQAMMGMGYDPLTEPPVPEPGEFMGRPTEVKLHPPVKLTEAQRHAMGAYANPEANELINSSLRAGIPVDPRGHGWNEPEEKMIKGAVPILDRLIAKHTVAEDTVVYRGGALTPDLAAQLVPGRTFTDKAFVSTSTLPQLAHRFASLRVTGTDPMGNQVTALGGEPKVLRIHVPAGTHMAPGQQSIGEFVLARGSRFHVDSEGPGVVDVSIVQ